MIWEGLKNRVFKQEHIEEIAEQRLIICRGCSLYDGVGTGCAIKGTQPCCNSKNQDVDAIDGSLKKGCGCSLALKTRSLHTECPLRKWLAVVNQQEAEMINTQINEAKN